MSNYECADLDKLSRIVRKYRKKLRQIERLEGIERELSEEEQYKVNSKNSIRLKLKEVMQAVREKEHLTRLAQGDSTLPSEDYEVTSLQDEQNFTCNNFSPPAKKSKQAPEETNLNASKVNSSNIPTTSTPRQSSKVCLVKQQKPHIKLRKSWKNKTFEVASLEGHNDIVCDVDCHSGWLVSGSRDTTIKLWELSTNEELKNISGHSGSVTNVKLLNKVESDNLRQHITVDVNELMSDLKEKIYDKELMLLSASTDCTIKLWLLPHGCLVKSIYNYSPITAMVNSGVVVFAGSDSGKLTVYNLLDGAQLCDMLIHDDTVTSLKCFGENLMSTSIDGDMRIWRIYRVDHGIKLDLIFSLVNRDVHVPGREILTACCCNNKIVYGDDGMNLKAVESNTGALTRFPNHANESGFTDSIIPVGNLLVSTSYDIDSGMGSLNVRLIDENANFPYITSLTHSHVPRLMCLAVDSSGQSNKFITGGSQLLIWSETRATADDGDKILIKTKAIAALNKTPASSDAESEATVDDDNENEGNFWWWSKPVATSSKQQSSENDDGYTDSDSSSQTISEHSHTDSSSSWWCTIV